MFAWRATVWAKEAALATRMSATADNAALAATLAAAEEARSDAAKQAERFEAQIKVAQEGVAAARAATIQADRAWVSISIEPHSQLVFEGDDVWINVGVTSKNLGRSPAIGVVLDLGLFASGGEANGAILKYTRERFVTPGHSYGSVVFPNGERSEKNVRIRMDRAAFIATANNAPEPDGESEEFVSGAFPAIVAGVQYCLPGETKRRFTYLLYSPRNFNGEPMCFDGSEGKFDVMLFASGLAGPIT